MKADILIEKYKEILYIQPKNEANFLKKLEQREVSSKDKRNISQPFSKLQKNEKMGKMSKFKRTSEKSL